MQNVKQLAFVLMQTFYLYIEYRMRVYFNTIVLLNILRKTNFILEFDIHKFLLCFFIIHKNRKFINFRQVCNPLITDFVCYPCSKFRISMKQETTLCNTICLVIKFLRHHFIEIF